MAKRKRKYSPRLDSGDARLSSTTHLPDSIMEFIDETAKSERTTRSWVVEQILLDWAGIKVKYVTSKKKQN